MGPNHLYVTLPLVQSIAAAFQPYARRTQGTLWGYAASNTAGLPASHSFNHPALCSPTSSVSPVEGDGEPHPLPQLTGGCCTYRPAPRTSCSLSTRCPPAPRGKDLWNHHLISKLTPLPLLQLHLRPILSIPNPIRDFPFPLPLAGTGLRILLASSVTLTEEQ